MPDGALLLSGVGVVAMVVAAVSVGRNKSKDETIDAQQDTIAALDVRVRSLSEQQAEEASRCAAQIAELRGKVDVLQSQQAEAIAGLMAPQIVTGLVRALHSGEWGPQ